MDRGAWRAAVHGVAESPAQLCDFHFIFVGSTGVNIATSRGCFLAVELGLQALQPMGSVVGVHGLSCPMACGIFLDQELNPCPCISRWILIHWISREVPILTIFRCVIQWH